MAHFAKLDNNNIVIHVIVVDNNVILDENGQESEKVGIEFCKNLFGQDTKWVQTSYNQNFRKRYAGIGKKYIPETDIFTETKLYPSWTYNVESDEWEPPVPKPADGSNYTWEWNEDIKTWTPIYGN